MFAFLVHIGSQWVVDLRWVVVDIWMPTIHDHRTLSVSDKIIIRSGAMVESRLTI